MRRNPPDSMQTSRMAKRPCHEAAESAHLAHTVKQQATTASSTGVWILSLTPLMVCTSGANLVALPQVLPPQGPAITDLQLQPEPVAQPAAAAACVPAPSTEARSAASVCHVAGPSHATRVGSVRGTRTASGRRKCTTERNRDKVTALSAQVAALRAAEAALSAQRSALVLKHAVLQGMIAVREDMAALCARHQHLKSTQQQQGQQQGEGSMADAPGSTRVTSEFQTQRQCSPAHGQQGKSVCTDSSESVPGMPDAALLRAAAMTPSAVAQAVNGFVIQASGVLLEYELAARDPISDALEACVAAPPLTSSTSCGQGCGSRCSARRNGSAAAATSGRGGGCCGVGAAMWQQCLQARTHAVLRAAVQKAGVQGTLPPRAVALQKLLSLTDSSAAVVRATLAVNPHVITALKHVNLETSEPIEALDDGALSHVCDKLKLTADQRAIIAIAVEQHEGVMARLQRERHAVAAVLNAAVRGQPPAPGACSYPSPTSLALAGALTRMHALLSREHAATHAMVAFLLSCVLTPVQALALHVYSWPHAADPLALAHMVARKLQSTGC